MRDSNIARSRYEKNWKNILTNIASWNPQETDKWIAEASERFELDDLSSWVYHKPPVYWVTGAIIGKSVSTPVSDADQLVLTGAILSALDFGAPDFSSAQNWDYYKARVTDAVCDYKERYVRDRYQSAEDALVKI